MNLRISQTLEPVQRFGIGHCDWRRPFWARKYCSADSPTRKTGNTHMVHFPRAGIVLEPQEYTPVRLTVPSSSSIDYRLSGVFTHYWMGFVEGLGFAKGINVYVRR